MTREEHLKWCKERTIQEMDYSKDWKQGIISMMSDLNKHPETRSESLQALCMMFLMKEALTRSEVITFINGFN
jgi:hypothetical protein